jgi:hypothetical protein
MYVILFCLLFDGFLYFTCGVSDLVGWRAAAVGSQRLTARAVAWPNVKSSFRAEWSCGYEMHVLRQFNTIFVICMF